MNANVMTPRRELLIAAGASFSAGLLAPATAAAQTPDAGTGNAPAIAAFNGKLYAVWKDAGTDAAIWYAAFDGANWSAAARIAKVATSADPSVAVFGNRLYVVWKGRNADQRLWYAALDGANWSAQAAIPGVTTSSAAALSVFNNKLYAVWKVSGTDAGLAWASFDGATWSTMPNPPTPVNAPVAPNPHPFSPQAIANSGLAGAGGIDQGKHNDCVFEATVAAVATTAKGQVAISQAILLNADYSYTVTFPGAPQRPIKVTQTDLKTTGVHDSATWADVLEAALIISDPNFANGSHPPPDATGAADGCGRRRRNMLCIC